MTENEKKALQYAERFGIIDYKVKGNQMIYRETLRGEGTYKATVNLKTMQETRIKLKRTYN